MARNHPTDALVELGFTTLEAEVYNYLLAESPATGYRVAQAIGRPVANTYKAIESLESKGAIIVEDGASRSCRAVRPKDLLAQLTQHFVARRQRAARALAGRRAESSDDRVYQLRTIEQLYTRCRRMLGEAREVVLMDAFPLPLKFMRADLERAAAREVTVLVRTYAPATIAGARVLLAVEADRILARWPGHWINLVVDGTQHLLGLISHDGDELHQAVWSGSAYLSWVYHCALLAEIVIGSLPKNVSSSKDLGPLQQTLDDFWELASRRVAGYRALMNRLEQPDSTAKKPTSRSE